MVLVSYSGREINAKLVYYGPGLSGKTTNLEYIYSAIPQSHRGKMVSMKTKTERTLFFDFLPIHLGELSGFKTRFLLYTVPGQVYYNATRKLVLKGVDAVVFVADSKRGKMDENIESLENLRTNLKEHGLNLDEIPWAIQYNKRDLPDTYSIEELERMLNPRAVPYFEAVATTGQGVFESFKAIARLLLKHLSHEVGVKIVANEPAKRTEPAAPPQAVLPASHEPTSVGSAETETVSWVPPVSTVETDSSIVPPNQPAPSTLSRGFVTGPESLQTDPPREGSGSEDGEATATISHELEETAGVGDRLRRWFSRGRDGEGSGPEPQEERSDEIAVPEGLTPSQEENAAPNPAVPVPLSVAGMSPEPPDSEPSRPEDGESGRRFREVPILVDLEPRDLEVGVVLKLRIAVRPATKGSEERSKEDREERAA